MRTLEALVHGTARLPRVEERRQLQPETLKTGWHVSTRYDGATPREDDRTRFVDHPLTDVQPPNGIMALYRVAPKSKPPPIFQKKNRIKDCQRD